MARRKDLQRFNWWYRTPNGFVTVKEVRSPGYPPRTMMEARRIGTRLEVVLLPSLEPLAAPPEPLPAAVVETFVEVLEAVSECGVRRKAGPLVVVATPATFEDMCIVAQPLYCVDIFSPGKQEMETIVLDLNEGFEHREVRSRGLIAHAVREIHPPPDTGLARKSARDPWSVRIFLEHLPKESV